VAELRSAGAWLLAQIDVHTADDWDQPAGQLQWTCQRTLDHLCDALSLYAGLVARRAQSSIAVPRDGNPEASPQELVDALQSHIAILAAVLDELGPADRAFHPAGFADRTGWLGMAITEILVHGYDIAVGLGIYYQPDAGLAERVARRVLPWTPSVPDMWTVLLWATGRRQVDGYAQTEPDWWWHPAPLDEWDGRRITRTNPPRWR